MIYVISDLHGYPLDKFKKLLKKAGFGSHRGDFLYILGDVVDRNGDGGAQMLYWLTEQPDIQLILGNHEAMLMACDFIFDEITPETIKNLDTQKMELLDNYVKNGGGVTIQGLAKLSKDQRMYILEYLKECPLYETVCIKDKDYLLVHAGLDNFSPDKKIDDYTADELIWTWPEIDDEYYTDIMTIFGHTSTSSYGEEYMGKIIKTKTWMDIDVGAGFGREPVLLRLDDMKEFR